MALTCLILLLAVSGASYQRAAVASAPETIIKTIAGGGPDNVPAVAANVSPGALTVDSRGNLYVTDENIPRIYKIDASGLLTAFAGDGGYGGYHFSGDDIPATGASLITPGGLAVDGTGNLFIADIGAQRVRRVDASTGRITTAAGNGTAGFSGDGGPATDAMLYYPSAVGVDALGNLFIAERGNQRIRRVDGLTGVISTVAGNGVAGYGGDGGPATNASLNNPYGMAVDGSGNLWISDTDNSRVRRVDVATGIINTVAGNGSPGYSGDGGPATSARINHPLRVAVDGSGNVLIADGNNSRIRRVDATTGIISTVAGNGTPGYGGDGGPATSASLAYPRGVAISSSGTLFIADSDNYRIRRVNAATGVIGPFAGNGMRGFSGDGGSPTRASLYYPLGVAVDAAGNVYVADFGNSRIRRVNLMSGAITTVAGNGVEGFSGDGGPATSASMEFPMSVAVDAAGNVFFADTDNARIRRVAAATGVITTVAGNGAVAYGGDGGLATNASLNYPFQVAVDGSGNLFIADSGNSRVRRVDAITRIISTVAGNGTQGFSGDGGPATAASLDDPIGVAVDGTGNLYIADSNNARIRRVAASTGVITTIAGNGVFASAGDGGPATSASFLAPTGLALDPAGELFISDTNDSRIRKVDLATGIISTVAGTGVFSFSGDGGPPTSATLNTPYGVAADASGNLLIADFNNIRIRMVGPTCRDIDGDGYGAPGSLLCAAGNGQTDCDDANGQIHPGATETCNGVDDNCNAAVDENQGSTTCGVGACRRTQSNCVNGTTQACVPGTPTQELCDGIDNDCNGIVDDRDLDHDGFFSCFGDCNDADPLIHPGVQDVCNGVDDNCNGQVDEDGSGVDWDNDGIHNACDNCRFAYNPTQQDTDHDSIGNACDNCVLVANPGQADLDADGRGDVCDNCPAQANAFQDDSDVDGVGDVCDDCPLDANADQGDFDRDLEGDVCDLDDGLIWTVLPDAVSVTWQREAGFETFNLYRGDLAVLKSLGLYTQNPATVPMAGRECDQTDAGVIDGIEPPTGQGVFYLVSGVHAGVEGSLGTNSAMIERPNANPCP